MSVVTKHVPTYTGIVLCHTVLIAQYRVINMSKLLSDDHGSGQSSSEVCARHRRHARVAKRDVRAAGARPHRSCLG